MFKRALFSIKEGFRHRAELKAIPSVKNITSIDWQVLYQSGVRVVVLDFDGVLAADKKKQLFDGVQGVLKTVRTIFGAHVYIFSNRPTPQREAYFAENFPHIQFLIAKQKPYPDGLLTVIAREQVDPERVVLIDDRILTGGLASVLAGTHCLLIEKPYICFWNNIIREVMFMSIRAVERAFFR